MEDMKPHGDSTFPIFLLTRHILTCQRIGYDIKVYLGRQFEK